MYSDADVERLQRILVYRSLGFDLTRIAEILDDPGVDSIEHLRQQHQLLTEQLERVQRMRNAVEAMMNAKRHGVNLTRDEMREVFGAFDPTQYEAEVEQRWGETPAYRESQRRTSQYDKQTWRLLGEEAERITSGLAAAMAAGTPATSAAAMDLAEEHRQHISRWFYECSYEVHRGLAEMYVADPRFAAHYDARAAGLSSYVRDAILANAARNGAR
jgi:DNA-binding transcriptional MerR regulator